MRRWLEAFIWAAAVLHLGCHRNRPKNGQSLAAPGPARPFDPGAMVVDPARIPETSAWRSLGPPQPSHAGPHRGDFQRIFLNPLAAQALDRGAWSPWPDGSQLVKEAFDRQGRRFRFFWMSKESGQWIFATGDVQGRVAARFPGESSGACFACHMAGAAAFDGAFTPGLAGRSATIGKGMEAGTPRIPAGGP